MYRTHGGNFRPRYTPSSADVAICPKRSAAIRRKDPSARPDMPEQAVFPWQIWSRWEKKRNRRTAEPLGKRSVLEAEPIGIVIKCPRNPNPEATQATSARHLRPVRTGGGFRRKPVPAAPSVLQRRCSGLPSRRRGLPMRCQGRFRPSRLRPCAGPFHVADSRPRSADAQPLQPFRLPAHVRPSGWRLSGKRSIRRAETRAEKQSRSMV